MREGFPGAGCRQATVGVVAVAVLAGGACKQEQQAREPQEVSWAEADPENGRRLLSAYGCVACHEIPGVPGANRLVGPPLVGFSRRSIIAGLLPNTPQMQVRWIMDPQEVDPGNAMPDLNVTLREARDMSAYLQTLE